MFAELLAAVATVAARMATALAAANAPLDQTANQMRGRVTSLKNAFATSVNGLKQLAGTNQMELNDLLKDVAQSCRPPRSTRRAST